MEYGQFYYDKESDSYVGRIHPDNFALVFGFEKEDCREDLNGMVSQLKAEAMGLA